MEDIDKYRNDRGIDRSMIKDPMRGITKKAVGAGPKISVIAVMLAMALGVAPKPKPQTPLVMTAAS